MELLSIFLDLCVIMSYLICVIADYPPWVFSHDFCSRML